MNLYTKGHQLSRPYSPVRSEKVRYGFSLTIWRLIMYSEIEGLVIFYQVEVH